MPTDQRPPGRPAAQPGHRNGRALGVASSDLPSLAKVRPQLACRVPAEPQVLTTQTRRAQATDATTSRDFWPERPSDRIRKWC